jgi:hypothetical protein
VSFAILAEEDRGMATAFGVHAARLRLHELPSDHGPDGINNPHRFEQ